MILIEEREKREMLEAAPEIGKQGQRGNGEFPRYPCFLYCQVVFRLCPHAKLYALRHHIGKGLTIFSVG